MNYWEERREKWTPYPDDARSAYDVDYSRIIHSASFRRLQGKTQILKSGDSDFYRTRLTHSLEVSQIATGIVRQLQKIHGGHPCSNILPDPSLIQSICLTHDLGHPPFGHGGEIALNYCMRDSGGFEANGQSLRILARLEKFSIDTGANVTRRTLLGVLKYPISYSAAHGSISPRFKNSTTAIHVIDREASKPPKCYYDAEIDIVHWVIAPLPVRDRENFVATITETEGAHKKSIHKSLDCSIMDISDDIAYGVQKVYNVKARYERSVPTSNFEGILVQFHSPIKTILFRFIRRGCVYPLCQ